MKELTPGSLAIFEEAIKDAIGTSRYDLWFGGNTRLSVEAGTLEIGVPNRFYCDWLESHFQEVVRSAAQRAFGRPLGVRFRIDPALFRQHRTESAAPRVAPPADPPRPAKRHRFCLARFVEGNSNRVAYAAICALIEQPRAGFSPLVIHGATGLGKTHLVKAAEEELKRRHRQLAISALTCEEYTNQFVEAMRANNLTPFRKKFRQLDVLIVDGVQFLANKRATQEEFFHTVNALEHRGAKVVLTSDAHPRRLPKIGEELKSRFVAGMVTKIDAPNRELRLGVLRSKAAERNLDLPADIHAFLADNLISSISELEGALNYLQHYSETLSAKLDLETARGALVEILRHSRPVLEVSEVKRRACDLFGINPRTLRDRSRSHAVTQPRMLILYLARRYTDATYTEIGREVGALNHSTVISAERKIRAQLESDREILLGNQPWRIRDAVEHFEREVGCC